MKYATTLPRTIALLLLTLLAACGDDDGSSTSPRVLSSSPADGAVGVALNVGVSATFSEAMDPESLTGSTFTVTAGGVPVVGTVIYGDSTPVFWPAAHLAVEGEYTATITTEAHSALGIPLAETYSWTFTTGDTLAPGQPVRLGTAGNYALLAKSRISTVPTSAITGDVAISPAAATYITGFDPVAHASNVYATSPQVTGKVYAADYAVPTPANLTTAVSDMELALTDAAGRAPDVIGLGAGMTGATPLVPGVYKWSTGLLIPIDLTLAGNATDVWIFQIAQDLTVSNGTSVTLTGGAVAKNVFWQVSGEVTLGTTAHLEGVVLSQTSITLQTGASVKGRLLAQTAIDIDSSTIDQPTP